MTASSIDKRHAFNMAKSFMSNLAHGQIWTNIKHYQNQTLIKLDSNLKTLQMHANATSIHKLQMKKLKVVLSLSWHFQTRTSGRLGTIRSRISLSATMPKARNITTSGISVRMYGPWLTLQGISFQAYISSRPWNICISISYLWCMIMFHHILLVYGMNHVHLPFVSNCGVKWQQLHRHKKYKNT